MNDTVPFLPVSRAAVFLDFDGTLAPIEATPDAVTSNPRTNALLKRLHDQLDGRLAVLSGRAIEAIDALTDGAVLCVAGVHGLERRSGDGALHRVEPDPAIPRVAEVMRAFAQARSGLIVEDKGASVALHYRLAQPAEEAVVEMVERLAHATPLQAQRGHMVVELKSPGPDKGEALRAFMNEPPFRGATPIYIGDDLTDEPAFQAAAQAGGYGILIGERADTSARYSLRDCAAALGWLEKASARGVFSPAGLPQARQ